jgi:diguanylate cyclase (GGDEF)-like protein/PAS domain S-box-containing protein
LRASDARLEDFAEASGGWFWETDAELRFSYLSLSVEPITGAPPEWHYGKTREEIGLPQSIGDEAFAAYAQTLAERRPFDDFEFPRAGPDGVRWLRSSGRPVFDRAGVFQGYRGVGLNITPAAEAERRFARLAAAVEHLTELFALWDENDRLVVCNEQFRALSATAPWIARPGTSFREHLAGGLAAGLFPDARGREQAWLEWRIERRRNSPGPLELARPDGGWLLVHEQRLPDGSMATIGTDITARKRIELAIREKAAILEASFHTIPDGILVLDRAQRPVAWNDRLFTILSIAPAAARAAAMLAPELRHLPMPGRTAERGQGAALPVREERQLAGGSWIEVRVAPIDDGGCVAVCRDITEPKRLQQQLELRATTDGLTGVLNRAQFFHLARAALSHARRHRQPLSLMVLDVDRFKRVNDTHGHAAGDAALCHVARICREHLREGDHFGRIGGEEFAAVLPMSDALGAAQAAEKLRALIAAAPVPSGGGALRLTASFGVAEWSGPEETIEQLTGRADALLYEAKRSGRNQVRFDCQLELG